MKSIKQALALFAVQMGLFAISCIVRNQVAQTLIGSLALLISLQWGVRWPNKHVYQLIVIAATIGELALGLNTLPSAIVGLAKLAIALLFMWRSNDDDDGSDDLARRLGTRKEEVPAVALRGNQ